MIAVVFLCLTLLGVLPSHKRASSVTDASRSPPVLIRTVSVDVDIDRLISVIDRNAGVVNIEKSDPQEYQRLVELRSKLRENTAFARNVTAEVYEHEGLTKAMINGLVRVRVPLVDTGDVEE